MRQLIRKSQSNSCFARSYNRPRRGVFTAWSIYALLLSGLCTALVINHLWLSAVRQDALRCAEASALAAGAGLLSDDMLRPLQSSYEHQWRTERSKLAAVQMSRFYYQTCNVPILSTDDIRHSVSPNDARKPSTSNASHRPNDVAQFEVPDYVTVSYGGLTADGQARHQVRLFLPGLTGIHEAAIGMHATVRIDHSPVGFQPSRACNVPMAPFGIPDSSDGSDTKSWTWLIERGHGRDEYSWVEETQAVTGGPDGLPEIKLLLMADTPGLACGHLVPANLNNTRLHPEQFDKWIAVGIAQDDIQSMPHHSVRFPFQCAAFKCEKKHLGQTADVIAGIIGRPTIFCLLDHKSTSKENRENIAASAASLTLTRPVAARVLNVRMQDKDNVEITLQPCVLTTSTAIMDPTDTRAISRYVYQVRLAY